MLLHKVKSSSISEIGYSQLKQTLGIVLNSCLDYIYLYINVTEETYLQLLNSKSKGNFFVKEIKPKYEFKKVQRKID